MNVEHHRRKVEESADVIQSRLSDRPTVGILTGTGLGQIGQLLHGSQRLAYAGLPHFPVSTVASHPGYLLCGRVHDHPVWVMQGRFHLYEGYSPLEVTFPIRVMQHIGVKTLIVTNASGGLNPAYAAGDIMIINDHLNLTGANPLIGPNHDDWGPRFPDMSFAYAPRLIQQAVDTALKLGIRVQNGVYAGLKGPSLETPAEVRYLQAVGADAVGFSTVLEVIAAVHAGMRVLGLSILTNVHQPDRPQPATLEEIVQTAGRAAPAVASLIDEVLKTIDES